MSEVYNQLIIKLEAVSYKQNLVSAFKRTFAVTKKTYGIVLQNDGRSAKFIDGHEQRSAKFTFTCL